MNHYDKQILEAQQEEKRRGHRTLETGIYVDDELITFEKITLPDTKIQMFLPMQETVRNSTVNSGFNVLPVQLEEGGTASLTARRG